MPNLPTSVQRVIDVARRKGVELNIVTFDESTHTAAEAARAVKAELGQIVKSLVFVIEAEDGPEGCIALVSGANTVDIGRLGAVMTGARLRRATAEEARALTGFPIGGIPPFGHVKPLRTVMDPDLGRYGTVWAAAGTPTAVFEVEPATLRTLANATVAPLAREEAAAPPAGQPVGESRPLEA
ncbi:MAG TPA: YbaK/EbsC family protein [Candidatus Limnocylindrales bacterium]|nr:YbaK/EbsC family protein [Candidatus Limnocylindrales bacterium]